MRAELRPETEQGYGAAEDASLLIEKTHTNKKEFGKRLYKGCPLA